MSAILNKNLFCSRSSQKPLSKATGQSETTNRKLYSPVFHSEPSRCLLFLFYQCFDNKTNCCVYRDCWRCERTIFCAENCMRRSLIHSCLCKTVSHILPSKYGSPKRLLNSFIRLIVRLGLLSSLRLTGCIFPS